MIRNLGTCFAILICLWPCGSVLRGESGGDEFPRRENVSGIPNAIRVHPNVLTGGRPSETGIKRLAELGIKTIVSVDATVPDIPAANASGMRYVHLPIGYGNIPESRIGELAKVFREFEGNVFIHCHHGRHRAPAMASAAGVAAGLIPIHRGLASIRLAGCDDRYTGLIASVRNARRLGPIKFRDVQLAVDVPAAATPLAASMAELHAIHRRIERRLESNKPMDQLETDSLLLKEQFSELLRREDSRDPSYLSLLRASERAAIEFLKDVSSAKGDTNSTAVEFKNRFKTISKHCQSCHESFR